MSVIIGGSMRGKSIIASGSQTVVVSGNKVIVDGKVVHEGDPLPEIDKTYSGVTNIDISGYDVHLMPGDELRVKGIGTARQSGTSLSIMDFEGSLEVPDIESLDIHVNSGSVRGSIRENQKLDIQANSGSVLLAFKSKKPIEIRATANSGDITINVN